MYPAHRERTAFVDIETEGYSEGIALDTSGYLSEGSGQNLFVVRNSVLYTPPATASILPGITRDSVMTLAKDHGFQVREEMLPREIVGHTQSLGLAGMAQRANGRGRVIANDCQNAAPQLPNFRVERFGEGCGAGNFAGNYGIPDRLGRRSGSRQNRGEVELLGETSRAPHYNKRYAARLAGSSVHSGQYSILLPVPARSAGQDSRGV